MLFFEAVIFLLTYSNVYLFPSFFDVAVLWLFFFLHMSEISCLKYIFLIQHQFFFHLFQHLLKLLIYCAIFYYFPFVWEVLRLFIWLSVLQLLMWSNSISFGITCQINLWAEKDRFFLAFQSHTVIHWYPQFNNLDWRLSLFDIQGMHSLCELDHDEHNYTFFRGQISFF